MAQVHLTDDEKRAIIEAFNGGTEPPSELAPKLFPHLSEKVDLAALDRARIPTLEYAGKRSKAAILAEASAGIGAGPLQVVRCFREECAENDWRNLIIQGDNLQFLKTCYKNADPLIRDKVKGKVKLIYIDPPFGTGDEYSGSQGEYGYSAKINGAEFIKQMRERLMYLHSLLAEEGALVMRIDYHFGHYLKVVLDEVFGIQNFVNELIINRIYKNVFGDSKFIPTSTDSLFVYSKSDKFTYKNIKIKRDESRKPFWRHMDDSAGVRNPRERIVFGKKLLPPPNKHFKYNQDSINNMIGEGRIRLKCSKCNYSISSDKDVWSGCPTCNIDEPKLQYLVHEKTHDNLQSNWTDIPGYSNSTGYPTENAEPLLKRVLMACADKNDLILDCFAGSGTTASVAEKLGMRWIMCDFGKFSIYTMQKRMLHIRTSKALEDDMDENGKLLFKKGDVHGKDANPFCILSAGAYDFSKIMRLRENKDAYIAFVLSLFEIPLPEGDLQKKYKLANISAEKNGNPVEVYPVWEDEYLKEIRIDEEYLQEIITQSGGKLKGDYFIVTPETCTVVGDTVLSNGSGDEVHFHILRFPYKILEDVSRKFQIADQPCSQDDINNLISSSAFYFNEDVELEAERIKGGLRIAKFKTAILSKDGEKLEGLEGLSMLLIDVNYDGKVFDMDTTVFRKDIDNGVVKLSNLSNSIAVIAIDRHGNESKPCILS